MRQIFLLFFTVLSVLGQPRITAVGNGADLSPALAPGALGSVLGTGLAAAPVSAGAVPLPTSLGGVAVSIGGQAARLSYVSPTQINFQVPIGVALGVAAVIVTNGAVASTAFPIPVSATAPGVYQYGSGRGVIQNSDFSLNGPGSVAPAGSTVTVYMTGIGVTSPAVADGVPAPGGGAAAVPVAKASATIGGATATLQFVGLTPGDVGLAQANIVVPNVASGDQPLVISLNGVASRAVQVSVLGASTGGGGTPSAAGGGPPDGLRCVSGQVDSVVFSLQYKLPGLADEVVIGGTRLCEKCDVKPPVFAVFVKQMELAREDGTTVDACYDGDGRVNAVQLRR